MSYCRTKLCSEAHILSNLPGACFCSSAAKIPAKFQSDWKTLKTDLSHLRLWNFSDILCNIKTATRLWNLQKVTHISPVYMIKSFEITKNIAYLSATVHLHHNSKEYWPCYNDTRLCTHSNSSHYCWSVRSFPCHEVCWRKLGGVGTYFYWKIPQFSVQVIAMSEKLRAFCWQSTVTVVASHNDGVRPRTEYYHRSAKLF